MCLGKRAKMLMENPTSPSQGTGLTSGGISIKAALSDTFALIEFLSILTDPSILFVSVFVITEAYSKCIIALTFLCATRAVKY